jgi:hypothetical protein
VFATRFVLFFVIPIMAVGLTTPSPVATGAVGEFTPSPQQRAILTHNTNFETALPTCDASQVAASSSTSIAVTYQNDGSVLSVPSSGFLLISYYYGQPVFSPGIPLCAFPDERTGSVDAAPTGSGSGYVYIPQPTGTVVTKIDVAPGSSPLPVGLVLVLVIAGATLAYDFVVTLKLRRAIAPRYTR